MRFAVQFVLFVALAASTLGAIDPVYNVTSGLEDYTLLVGRQMQIDLDIGELQLTTVKARHADRIEAIANQQQLVLQEVQQFDNILLQQQAFSLNRKHCVQKYKSISPTYDQVNKNFTQCLAQVEVDSKYLTVNAEQSLQNARYIREQEVPVIFINCNKTYSALINLEKCVREKIDSQLWYFNQYMESFSIKLTDSLYTSSVVATKANQCTFTVEKKVLQDNGAVSNLADVCVENFNKNGVLALPIENGNVMDDTFMQRLMSRGKLIN